MTTCTPVANLMLVPFTNTQMIAESKNVTKIVDGILKEQPALTAIIPFILDV